MSDIYNKNKKNMPSLDVYDSFNKFIFSDDINSNNDVVDQYINGDKMKIVYDRVVSNDLEISSVINNLENTKIDDSKYILVKGDVSKTTKEFVENNPGFRISLLYIDLDLDEPCYNSLNNLWDRILPGGIIVFDEYEYHKFDESVGVDRFLKDNNKEYEIISTNWIAPTSYMIKKKF